MCSGGICAAAKLWALAWAFLDLPSLTTQPRIHSHYVLLSSLVRASKINNEAIEKYPKTDKCHWEHGINIPGHSIVRTISSFVLKLQLQTACSNKALHCRIYYCYAVPHK
ncbi:unnamed protein product [Ostreobium quekettii]|uniref:Secreted protein n=1 Tax=Ostreobium quekettii TaxID=121088 RepID=A0A8S1ISV1_9CHLO|nr:unnamed protein product [Ostreobium quekettii]